MTVSGTVDPVLPSVKAEIGLFDVGLTSLQPYIEPYITLKLESASVSARGNLSYGIPGTDAKVMYQGDFSLNNLRFADPQSQKPYLSWDAMKIPRIKLSLQPQRLEIPEIVMIKPVGELIIGEDRTLNFTKVIRHPDGGTNSLPPSAQEDTPGKDALVYHISKFKVEKGDLAFADLSLQPKFMTRIHDIQGEITALSSAKNARAKISLDGDVDKYGIAKISGVIRQRDFRRSSHIEMVFRNLEMKDLSPYSGKFAGRLITSGKVFANLNYTIHDYKMLGENKIIIKDLVLGRHIDEPGAADLPLDLAVALLEDSHGRINIGLPITGDLNDPQFSFGPLIGRLFTNLITKVVTAPFRALGEMFGGDYADFDVVRFTPGSFDLLPPAREKLVQLVDALKNRPQLKLVIQGRYSPETDGPKLKDMNIRRLVATRLGEKIAPNEIPEVPDFTDAGTQELLQELYAERIVKPSLADLAKGLETGAIPPLVPIHHPKKVEKQEVSEKTPGRQSHFSLFPQAKSSRQAVHWARELYARLVENVEIQDQVFLQLARNRAQSIVAGLADQIPKGRISIKDPEPQSGKRHPSARLSLEAFQGTSSM